MQVSLCVKRQPGLLRTNLCEENLKKKKKKNVSRHGLTMVIV